MKIWEVRTLSDFVDFLHDLANKDFIFYGPLYEKALELRDFYNFAIKFSLAAGFAIGALTAYLVLSLI